MIMSKGPCQQVISTDPRPKAKAIVDRMRIAEKQFSFEEIESEILKALNVHEDAIRRECSNRYLSCAQGLIVAETCESVVSEKVEYAVYFLERAAKNCLHKFNWDQ